MRHFVDTLLYGCILWLLFNRLLNSSELTASTDRAEETLRHSHVRTPRCYG